MSEEYTSIPAAIFMLAYGAVDGLVAGASKQHGILGSRTGEVPLGLGRGYRLEVGSSAPVGHWEDASVDVAIRSVPVARRQGSGLSGRDPGAAGVPVVLIGQPPHHVGVRGWLVPATQHTASRITQVPSSAELANFTTE